VTPHTDEIFYSRSYVQLAPYSKKMLLDDDVDNMGLGQKLALAAFIKEVKFMGMWRIGSEAPKESVPLFTSRMIVAIDHNIRDYLAENRCKDAEIQIINSQWSFSKSNPDLQSAMRYRSMLMNMRDYMPPHITEGEKRAMLRQVGVKI
jgi:tRNA(His) 5'-end guanylyltransferase